MCDVMIIIYNNNGEWKCLRRLNSENVTYMYMDYNINHTWLQIRHTTKKRIYGRLNVNIVFFFFNFKQRKCVMPFWKIEHCSQILCYVQLTLQWRYRSFQSIETFPKWTRRRSGKQFADILCVYPTVKLVFELNLDFDYLQVWSMNKDWIGHQYQWLKPFARFRK